MSLWNSKLADRRKCKDWWVTQVPRERAPTNFFFKLRALYPPVFPHCKYHRQALCFRHPWKQTQTKINQKGCRRWIPHSPSPICRSRTSLSRHRCNLQDQQSHISSAAQVSSILLSCAPPAYCIIWLLFHYCIALVLTSQYSWLWHGRGERIGDWREVREVHGDRSVLGG